MLWSFRPFRGRSGPSGTALQPWIDRFRFQREDARNALVDAVEWLGAREPLERFGPERELAERETSLPPQRPRAEPVEVLWERVFGSVDNPQILAAAHLYGGLDQPLRTLRREVHRLHDHPLHACLGAFDPPRHGRRLIVGVEHVH